MNNNLYRLLAAHFPEDKTAACMILPDGRVWTYGDVERASARIAHLIVPLGLHPGDRVAAQVENTPEALVLYLASLRAGMVFLPLNPAYQRAPNPAGRLTRDLDFWIGRWEGDAVFEPAFQPAAKVRPEKFAAECRAVLPGNYIQCDGTFARADGRARGVMWLWNYNEIAGAYEGMTLASNYGQETTFRIAWDENERAYIGMLPTRTADGRAATERLVFRPSSDRTTIEGLEMLRPDDSPEAAWITTFKYTWRRVGR